MEIFYSEWNDGRVCRFDEGESGHMVRVLRHRSGDEVLAVDGLGTLFRCRLTSDSPREAEAEIQSKESGWGSHPYDLTLAVCPTKNGDRYEWFAEKTTEIGVDTIVPIIGEHSERRVFRPERVRRVLVSASKQSLKAKFPLLRDQLTVKDFIAETAMGGETLKLIAYCFEGETSRVSVKKAMEEYGGRKIIVLIGPEGDFSREEAEAAIAAGYIPVALGSSRLRTETAGVVSAAAAYLRYM